MSRYRGPVLAIAERNCATAFYEKCGFTHKEFEMVKYAA